MCGALVVEVQANLTSLQWFGIVALICMLKVLLVCLIVVVRLHLIPTPVYSHSGENM